MNAYTSTTSFEIVETASKEKKVEIKLAIIDDTWAKLDLDFSQHKDTEISLVKAPDEVVEALEQNQLELQVRREATKRCDEDRRDECTNQRYMRSAQGTRKYFKKSKTTWESLRIFLGGTFKKCLFRKTIRFAIYYS